MKKPQQMLFCIMSLPGVRPWPNLTKYDVCTLVGNHSNNQVLLRGQKEINPTSVGLISFWDPATSYSPGPSPAKYHRR